MNYIDDYMFPTTTKGMKEADWIFESASKGKGKGNSKGKKGVKEGCEEDDDDGDIYENAIANYSRQECRIKAMTSVIDWISLGEYTYAALDNMIIGMLDADEGEPTEDDNDLYNAIWDEIPEALLTLGADPDDVDELCDGPNEKADSAGVRIGSVLSDTLNELEAEDADIVNAFAFGEEAVMECAESSVGVFEAVRKRMKVFVKDGKKVRAMKKVGGNGLGQMSAGQKAALKKARRMAWKGAAKLARRKSMRKRKQLGLG